MNGRNRELFAHLSLALSRYDKEVRRDGITAPAELLVMAEFFADCATARQGATIRAPADDPGNSGHMTSAPLLTKRQVASALGVSVRQVERLIAGSALTAVLVGAAVRVRRSDLDDYIRELAPKVSGSFRDQIEEKTA